MRITDAFPSSVAFDAINESLQSSEADRKDAIKQGNAVFAFTLKNTKGETESWHIDLKEKGAVGTGLGTKPNGKLPSAESAVHDGATLTTSTTTGIRSR